MTMHDNKEKWEQVKHEMHAKWGRLENNQFKTVTGQREELIEMLREEYSLSKEVAAEEVETFLNSWRNRTFN